ncbi:FKBP-type peptidyl-prolyl cis-trans isomerase [Chitinophaga alhagiae]|uniref:FKBP-type peptidyl-prolyl cis-trans isomerase n=1 Tax=Chitinophaga alhagiae TaxID=2203219 RepID=UPI000E5BDE10|nr:FKBP-type peptidyl-prolyl cis-trans isomerase [Chitinophaga alhagiae]
MKRHYFWLLSLLAISIFAACKKKDNPPPYDPVKQAVIDEQLIQEHITRNNITGTLKDTSGLHYKIMEHGTPGDTIALDDRMNITYVGTLLNGNQFDAGEKTTLGEYRLENLIEGWKIGLRKISKGGKVLLLVPSGLGYKNANMGSIPPNSVLVFEITLHNFYY